MTGNTTVTGNTFVTGNTLVTGNTTVTGNTNVVGNTYLTGNSFVTGNTYVTGTTTVTGNTFVTGAVTTITGNTYLAGNSFVNGPVVVTGNTTVTGNAIVTGNVTLTGNGYITGNTFQYGRANFFITNDDQNLGGMEISGNNTVAMSPLQTGVMLHVTGQPASVSRVYNDSQGSYSLYTGRRMNGTTASPSQVLANSDLLRIAGTGYTSAGMANIGPARISFVASEDLTATNQGGRIEFWLNANSAGPAYSNIQRIAGVDPAQGVFATQFNTAGNVNANIATIGNIVLINNTIYSQLTNADLIIGQSNATANLVINRATVHNKDVYITGNVNSTSNVNTGNVNTISNVNASNVNATSSVTAGNIFVNSSGTLNTPRVIINDGGIRTVNGGTTLTVDFSVDSRILWYVPSGDTTITLSNYTAGAQVEVIVRMGASGRNIALGIAGTNNSTTGATSLTGHGPGAQYGANQAVYLKYLCYDNTQANCYVQASYV